MFKSDPYSANTLINGVLYLRPGNHKYYGEKAILKKRADDYKLNNLIYINND